MTPDPISISPDSSVADAGELMAEKKFRHLIVMEQGSLLGLLTRSSLGQALPGLGTGLTRFEYSYLTSNTSIRDVMITDPLLCNEDMPAEEAARIMNANRISSLVVMEDDYPVGIITDTDIFEAMLELLGAKRRGVRVTAHLVNRPGELAKLSQVIAEAGGNIAAIGAWEIDASTVGAVMKVEELSAKKVRTAIEATEDIKLADLRDLSYGE
jgi:acetoin utilization protein AcuB